MVQDACLRAMKYIGSLDGEDGRSWFLTIVRRAFVVTARAGEMEWLAASDLHSADSSAFVSGLAAGKVEPAAAD